MHPFRLDGSVALVTGGTRGIGLATATLFRSRGARVVVCGRSTVGETVCREHDLGFVHADVTEEDAVRDLVRATVDRHGRLDTVVDNAGPTDLLHSRDTDGPIGELTLEAWRRLIDRTLTCGFLVSHPAASAIVDSGGGSIITMSSIAAAQAMPSFDAYAAGKAGLEAMTRPIAIGYAHLGVQCSAIRIGSIAVDHGDQNRRQMDAALDDPEAPRRAEPPRLGSPDSIAHAAFLLSAPSGAYVNGTVLVVDGGLGARSLMPWQTERPRGATDATR